MSARLIEHAVIVDIQAGGFAISALMKCIPDASFIDSREQLGIKRNMFETISVSVITDCDTGYEDPLNVMRTVDHREWT